MHHEGASCSAGTCISGTCGAHKEIPKSASWGTKIVNTLRYAYIETVGDIAVHFLIGLVIAALITMFLPAVITSYSIHYTKLYDR